MVGAYYETCHKLGETSYHFNSGYQLTGTMANSDDADEMPDNAYFIRSALLSMIKSIVRG